MTYLWPTACGIYAAVSIRYIYEGSKLKWYNYILFTVMLIYGANLEQMGIMMTVTFTIALAYFIYVVFAASGVLVSQRQITLCADMRRNGD